jgi:hypothetical protein
MVFRTDPVGLQVIKAQTENVFHLKTFVRPVKLKYFQIQH